MAPLLQNLSVLSARVAAEMPRPVAEPAMRLLNQRITLDRGAPTATTLKQAVLSAGVLTSPSSAGADTKTALLQLRAGLLAMLGDGEIAPVAPVARRPPPPHKDAQPRAMRAEPPTLPANTEPRDAARTLLGQTDAALSRLKLLQLASQPQETRPGVPVLPDLHIEIPMVLGHETAMAQLRIQKDGKGGGKPSERGWRLLCREFLQIGEVGAQVSLIGDDEHRAGPKSLRLPQHSKRCCPTNPALAARGLTVGSVTAAAANDSPPRPAGSWTAGHERARPPRRLAVALEYERAAATPARYRQRLRAHRRADRRARRGERCRHRRQSGARPGARRRRARRNHPVELYEAVAEVIGFVLRARQKMG